MEEQKSNKEAAEEATKETSSADESNTVNNGGSTDTDSVKKESLIDKIKGKRKEKADARRSYALDAACLIFICVFAAFFKAKNYVGQSTPLLYYYEDAIVISNEEIAYDDSTRWCVTIEYSVGGESHRRNLYYKRNPKYETGDVLELKIQTVNPDNIEIEGKK